MAGNAGLMVDAEKEFEQLCEDRMVIRQIFSKGDDKVPVLLLLLLLVLLLLLLSVLLLLLFLLPMCLIVVSLIA